MYSEAAGSGQFYIEAGDYTLTLEMIEGVSTRLDLLILTYEGP